MATRSAPSLLTPGASPGAFRSRRRQRFLTAEIHAKNLAWTTTSVTALTEAIDHHLKEGNDSPIGQRGIFLDLLNLFRLEYTAGRAISDLKETFSAAVSRYCQWHMDYLPHARRIAREAGIELRDDATPIDFEDLEEYQDAATLVSIAALFGDGAALQAIAELLQRYRGEDMLFDAIVEPVCGATDGTEFFHIAPYDPLVDAFYTAETPTEASAFVQRYLEGWYPAFRGCSWHDGHLVRKDHMSPYNGYWAFEAAAICVIHAIDDTPFRDHLVYPKNFADWARENDSIGRLRTFARTPSAPASTRLRCLGGHTCPRAGVWRTPADPSATRQFAAGETMPELRSEFGVTIWQMDRTSR